MFSVHNVCHASAGPLLPPRPDPPTESAESVSLPDMLPFEQETGRKAVRIAMRDTDRAYL
jgi:hypothetical protein